MKDARAQAPLANESRLDPRADGVIHPETGRAFLDPFKLGRTQTKSLSNQGIEVDSPCEKIASKPLQPIESRKVWCMGREKSLSHLRREKSRLGLVVGLVIVIAIPHQTAARVTPHPIDPKNAVIEARLSEAPLEIMTRGKEDRLEPP